MSPLTYFLVFIVILTALTIYYLTKQFQEENLIYSSTKKMENTNETKKIEREKVVAETINGRFAMIGLIAAIGAYLTTGQIIPGFV